VGAGVLRWPRSLENFMKWAAAILLSACLSPVARSQVAGAAHPGLSVHQERALAQLKGGYVREALSEFRAAVAENPHDAVSHDYIGVLLGESGKLDEALAEFEQAARLEPSFPDPHFHLGLAYERTGRPGEAISEYHEALRLNPALLEARYGLSAICVKLGDLDGAIRLLRQVIKAAPEFGEARYNLGRTSIKARWASGRRATWTRLWRQ
jgi:tetratricopeptide (TPR) repeat protein